MSETATQLEYEPSANDSPSESFSYRTKTSDVDTPNRLSAVTLERRELAGGELGLENYGTGWVTIVQSVEPEPLDPDLVEGLRKEIDTYDRQLFIQLGAASVDLEKFGTVSIKQCSRSHLLLGPLFTRLDEGLPHREWLIIQTPDPDDGPALAAVLGGESFFFDDLDEASPQTGNRHGVLMPHVRSNRHVT